MALRSNGLGGVEVTSVGLDEPVTESRPCRSRRPEGIGEGVGEGVGKDIHSGKS